MMAMLAKASFLADRKAAQVKLPDWRRCLVSNIAQVRLIARAPAPVTESGVGPGTAGGRELLPNRPNGCHPGYQEYPGQGHSNSCSLNEAPAERGEDEEVDRGVFEKVDTVGEQGDGSDCSGNHKLDPDHRPLTYSPPTTYLLTTHHSPFSTRRHAAQWASPA